MKVTSTTITRNPWDNGGSPVAAYATVVIDDALAIHNLRLIRNSVGRLFVAMPSQRSAVKCPTCHFNVILPANYCHRCGYELAGIPKGFQHHDVVHPIQGWLRDAITEAVLAEYERQHLSMSA